VVVVGRFFIRIVIQPVSLFAQIEHVEQGDEGKDQNVRIDGKNNQQSVNGRGDASY
jgi:hypothetical protein